MVWENHSQCSQSLFFQVFGKTKRMLLTKLFFPQSRLQKERKRVGLNQSLICQLSSYQNASREITIPPSNYCKIDQEVNTVYQSHPKVHYFRTLEVNIYFLNSKNTEYVAPRCESFLVINLDDALSNH